MAKAYVLDKVDVDVAHGRTQPAIQRLSSLVAVHPHDLDLRHRLAAVHRMTGNAIEAGRWDYLSQGTEPAEISAFERAFPSAAQRLRALRWEGSADLAPTDHARTRLAELAAAAAAELPVGVPVAVPQRRPFLVSAAALVGGGAVLALAVLGVMTIVGWLT
ncbi:DUF6584 family protein [Hamadaea tsunoensis]|uniref:DUF6584 family protein n=1 Tax=Hamadaea tsunoensis TaxID=53368 RepID=UPI0012F93ABD|nr:DUF6584 family protein [Hamadaea tsunoensis]